MSNNIPPKKEQVNEPPVADQSTVRDAETLATAETVVELMKDATTTETKPNSGTAAIQEQAVAPAAVATPPAVVAVPVVPAAPVAAATPIVADAPAVSATPVAAETKKDPDAMQESPGLQVDEKVKTTGQNNLPSPLEDAMTIAMMATTAVPAPYSDLELRDDSKVATAAVAETEKNTISVDDRRSKEELKDEILKLQKALKKAEEDKKGLKEKYHLCLSELKRQRAVNRELRGGGKKSLKNAAAEPPSRKNFVGSKHDIKWRKRFNDLCQFKERFGHCNVSQGNHEYSELSKWVVRQRCNYKLMIAGKKSDITPERVEMLTGVGFEWNHQKTPQLPWESRFRQLQDYVAHNGNADVPATVTEPKGLRSWVIEQRKYYRALQRNPDRKNTLSAERIKMLENVGFNWNAK